VGRADHHRFRRKLAEVEEGALAGPTAAVVEAEARAALAPLADAAGAAAQARVDDLAAVIAGRRPRSDYVGAHGVAGVRRFTTAGGRSITLLPIETFPDHVNNVYLVRDRDRAFLFDAGSLFGTARRDFERAARVLAAVHGDPGVLDRVEDVIVSHGHIDHHAAVGRWRKQGARVHVHELDARVVSSFAERVVVTARALRQFLQAAGVDDRQRGELEQMYVMSKAAYRSVPVDRLLTDGAVVCGAVAHHVAGHCPGQICLQVDDVLLTADHVLPRITPHQAPESITPSTGLDHYFESLEKIRRVGGIALALPGHEEPIARLADRIGEIEAFHRTRLDEVRAICRSEPRTVCDVAQALFGDQQGYGRILAYEEAGAHVEFLARRGLVEVANLEAFDKEQNPVVLYRAA